VPGKVLWASNYYLLSRQAGVDVREIGGSFLISTALWILTVLICSLSSIWVVYPALRYGPLVLPVLLLVSIHPPMLSLFFALGGWILRKVGRTAEADQMRRCRYPIAFT